MKAEWSLRQILATVRGIAFMLGAFWIFIGLQFVPAFLRNGPAGLREHMIRVAVAGVPPEHWPMAIARMQGALSLLGGLALGLYVLQRYLARKVAQFPHGRAR